MALLTYAELDAQEVVSDRHDAARRRWATTCYALDDGINTKDSIDRQSEGPAINTGGVEAHRQRVGRPLTDLFGRAQREHRPTGAVADPRTEAIVRD